MFSITLGINAIKKLEYGVGGGRVGSLLKNAYLFFHCKRMDFSLPDYRKTQSRIVE